MDGSLRYVKNRNEFEMINQQKNGQMPAPNRKPEVAQAQAYLAKLREIRNIPDNRSPLDFMGKDELAANSAVFQPSRQARINISYRFGNMRESIKRVQRRISNDDVKMGGENR